MDYLAEQKAHDRRCRKQRKEMLLWARKRYPGLKWKGRDGSAVIRGTRSAGFNRITTIDISANRDDSYFYVHLWEGTAKQVIGEGETKEAAVRDLETDLRRTRDKARVKLAESERALASLKSARKNESD